MVVTDDIELHTRGRGFTELTHALQDVVSRAAVRTGICSATIRHTSASLIVCENADPDVLSDLERFMSRLVPDGDPMFRHDAEGDDDMPAHVRSILTHSDLSLPVRNGALLLGTWQGVYLWEHRAEAHRRNISVTIFGEA